MNTTQTPNTTTAGPLPHPGGHRRWRYVLTGLVVFAATLALFYTEENWRGRRAWENCKRELEAKGAKLDWSYYIPPPVPDDKNIFAVPEMQKWFVGKGGSELSSNLGTIYTSNSSTARLVVAKVAIGLPGAIPVSGFAVLALGDAGTTAEAGRLIREAVGPIFVDPVGIAHTTRRLEEIQAAKIFLRCQTVPTTNELDKLFAAPPFARWSGSASGYDKFKIEPAGDDSYQVTMPPPTMTAEFIAWNARFEKDFNLIRQALQRPYARMVGDYQYLTNTPIPNFVSLRVVAQRLGALAQCHLMQGQPEEALRDLTLIHDLCRMLKAPPSGRPMTLFAAMMNVALTGLDTSMIADGLAWHAWQEPQLAALQEQLREINLRPYVSDAFALEQASGCHLAESCSMAQLMKLYKPLTDTVVKPSDKPVKHAGISFPKFSLWSLVPQGWVYQNMVFFAQVHETIREGMDPLAPVVTPHKVNAAVTTFEGQISHSGWWTPFKLLGALGIPNFSRATKTTAHNQTSANQAQIACALERYRLAHGEYPPTLEALIPQFIGKIPLDVIGGQPPHYRRTDDGKFLLYSIGWSEKDLGGKPGRDGDWIWDDSTW